MHQTYPSAHAPAFDRFSEQHRLQDTPIDYLNHYAMPLTATAHYHSNASFVIATADNDDHLDASAYTPALNDKEARIRMLEALADELNHFHRSDAAKLIHG